MEQNDSNLQGVQPEKEEVTPPVQPEPVVEVNDAVPPPPVEAKASEGDAPPPPPPPSAGNSNTTTLARGPEGPNGPFPEELRRWNWGSFFLSWIWGIGHNVWITFLFFLPTVLGILTRSFYFGEIGTMLSSLMSLFSLGFAIYLGIKGNELAWQNRKFESVEQFKAVEKIWAIWGLVLFLVSGLFLVIAFLFIIFAYGGMLGGW